MRENKKVKSLVSAIMLIALTFGSATFFMSFHPPEVYASPEGYDVVYNPYDQVDWNTWLRLKTQIHCHTTQSDGLIPPAELIDEYKAAGYDALGISDHDKLTWPWSNWGRDPATLGMVDIPNNELSNYHHMTSAFVSTLISGYSNVQQAIDRVLEQGGIPVLAHPWLHNKWGGYNYASYDGWTGFEGIEIFNPDDNEGQLAEYNFVLWDRLLTDPNREKHVWGFAVDDAHTTPAINQGWITVYAPQKTRDSLKASIKAGSFLAVRNNEATINNIRQEGRQLIISTAESVVWKANGLVTIGTTNTLNLDGLASGYTYVRAEVGSGPTFTQPIFIQSRERSSFPVLGNEIIALDLNTSCWDGTRGGPHNLDIVELNKDGHRYWGYYSTANHDAVGLAFSEDLEHWVRYSTTTPVIDGVGWPTVGIQNNMIHMFYIKGYPTADQKIYRATSPVSDGYHFTEQELVVDNPNCPHDPFLWHNPVDGEWWLLWKEQINVGTIKCRHANNIEDLSSVSSMILRTETDPSYNTLAAPGIFYWAGVDTYYLTDEAQPSVWTTRAFYSDVLAPGCFDGACECTNSPILSDDDACGFPHVEGNVLYYYYSHRVGPGHQWNTKLRKANLAIVPPPPPEPTSWWKASWQYRKKITIDYTKVTEDLTNFPVLIDTTSSELASHAQDDGDDIVFTNNASIKLNHEIESYDNTSGHLVAWVSANLSSTKDTVLYLYYGNPAAPNQQNPTAVWDSNYVMVQHLEETGPQVNPLPWDKYAGNPILNGYRTGFASSVYDSDTGIYHLFCGWGSVQHFTSPNGKTEWTADPAPVLEGNEEGVPMVWKEGDTWYMLYRYGGPGPSTVIGLANSTDATHWTRYEGNPVLTGTPGTWDEGYNGLDPWGVIKVGSTYYLWYKGGPTYTGLATSTDLKHWTKDSNNPILTGGRYCVFAFKYEGYYYLLVPHYTSFPYGQVELYRDSNPTFYEGQRTYLGVAIDYSSPGEWDDHRFDTPCVLTDNIFRDTYTCTNNELWVYYAATGTPTGSGANWWTGMCIEPNISEALLPPINVNVVVSDSTSNHNDGQTQGLLDLNAVGKIDGADYFQAAWDGYIDCGNTASLKGMTALTVEAWFKSNAWNNGIVAKWGSSTPGTGGSYIIWQGSAGDIGWEVISETNKATVKYNTAVPLGGWHHVVGTYDGSQVRLYIDGVEPGTPTSLSGRVASTDHPCYIGRYTWVRMNGFIDEARISNAARSASWILTEYRNQYNPSTFYGVGSEETLSCTIKSCDSTWIPKDRFLPTETVYVNGSGYPPSDTYNIYVVNHQMWNDGDPIPMPPVASKSASPESSGKILTAVWSPSPTLEPGYYDIIVDVNGNGEYDAGFDALDNMGIYNAGFFVIPEYAPGTILALAVCFGGFAVYKRSKHTRLKT